MVNVSSRGSTEPGGCIHVGSGPGFDLDAPDHRRYRPDHTSQPAPFGSVRTARMTHPGTESGSWEASRRLDGRRDEEIPPRACTAVRDEAIRRVRRSVRPAVRPKSESRNSWRGRDASHIIEPEG